MCGHFKDGVLEACDEGCGKRGGRSKGDTLWQKKEVKVAISRKNDAHKAMCQDNTEENKGRYESMKNKAKKAVSIAIRERRLKRCIPNKKLPKWDV